MGDPLSKRIRDFGRPVPQKPSSKISTPPPPVSGVRGSSRRTKRKTVTRTTPVTPKESEPGVVTSKDVKADVYRSALPVLRKGYEQYKSIDPSAKYKLESGEIISGKELQSRYREQLYSGMKSTIQTSSRVQPGQYVKTSGGEYYKLDKQSMFILETTEPEQRKQILQSFESKTVTPEMLFSRQTPTQSAFQKGYEKLSSREKDIYGLQFTKWESLPVEDIKYYPGGKQYIQRNKPEVTQRYLENLKYTPGKGYEYKGKGVPYIFDRLDVYRSKFEWQGMPETKALQKAKEKLAFEEVSQKRPVDYYFDTTSELNRFRLVTKQGLAYAISTPVTFTQGLIKLGTGRSRPLVFPDISAKIGESSPLPDLAGSATQEVWFGKEVDSYTKERQKKYLGYSVYGSVVSYGGGFVFMGLGMKGVSVAAKAVSPYARTGGRYLYAKSGLQPQKAFDVFKRVRGTYPFQQAGKFKQMNVDLRIGKSVMRQPSMRVASQAWTNIERGVLESGRTRTGIPSINISGLRNVFREPSARDYMLRYGKGYQKPWSPYAKREGITTLEQTLGKRPDPFMSSRPSGKFGGYETSWSFYRKTLRDPTYGVVGTRPIPKFGGLGQEFKTSNVLMGVRTKPGTPLKFYQPSEIPGTIQYGYTSKGGGVGVTQGLAKLTSESVKKSYGGGTIEYATGGVKSTGSYSLRDLQLLDFLEYGTQTPSRYWSGVRPGGQVFEHMSGIPKTGKLFGGGQVFEHMSGIPKTGKLFGASGVTSGKVTPLISYSAATGVFSVPFKGMVYNQKPLSSQIQLPSFNILQEQPQASSSIQGLRQLLGLGTAQVSISKQVQIQTQQQKTKMDYSMQTVTITTPTKPSYKEPQPPRINIPFIPTDKSIYGRGSKGDDFKLFGKKKQFRAVKISSPLKGLKL